MENSWWPFMKNASTCPAQTPFSFPPQSNYNFIIQTKISNFLSREKFIADGNESNIPKIIPIRPLPEPAPVPGPFPHRRRPQPTRPRPGPLLSRPIPRVAPGLYRGPLRRPRRPWPARPLQGRPSGFNPGRPGGFNLGHVVASCCRFQWYLQTHS